jgi:hypothetical protein
MAASKHSQESISLRVSLFLLIFMFATAGNGQNAAKPHDENQSEWADRLVSDYFGRSPAFSLGFDVQACQILGDRVAIAVAKKVHLGDLTATPTARRVLELLEFAFSEPELIVDAENSHPAVTLFLAEFLSEYGMESSIRLRAGDPASRFRMLAKAR